MSNYHRLQTALGLVYGARFYQQTAGFLVSHCVSLMLDLDIPRSIMRMCFAILTGGSPPGGDGVGRGGGRRC